MGEVAGKIEAKRSMKPDGEGFFVKLPSQSLRDSSPQGEPFLEKTYEVCFMNYTVIHSNRKTLALQIKNGELIVRAPRRMSLATIERFVAEHEKWINKHLAKAEKQRAEALPVLSPEELQELTERARRVFSERVTYFAPIVGVDYARISIRHQGTRWGSCSAKGNLNFNCLLLLAPPEVLDSIVVHELCHRKEMNHSPRFYAEVYRVCPDYDACHAWLKEHGQSLMSRLPK